MIKLLSQTLKFANTSRPQIFGVTYSLSKNHLHIYVQNSTD